MEKFPPLAEEPCFFLKALAERHARSTVSWGRRVAQQPQKSEFLSGKAGKAKLWYNPGYGLAIG